MANGLAPSENVPSPPKADTDTNASISTLAIRKPPSFLENQQIIKLLLGPKKTPFHVHEGHACYHSGLIAQKVSDRKSKTGSETSDSPPSDEQITIELPDIDDDIFGYFQNFIYTKSLCPSSCSSSSSPSSIFSPQPAAPTPCPLRSSDCLRLHLMGEMLSSPGFTNLVIKHHLGTRTAIFETKVLVHCWEQSAPGSSLRRLARDVMIHDLAVSDFASTVDKLPVHIVRVLAKALMDRFDAKYKAGPPLRLEDYYEKES